MQGRIIHQYKEEIMNDEVIVNVDYNNEMLEILRDGNTIFFGGEEDLSDLEVVVDIINNLCDSVEINEDIDLTV